jgi:predicted ATPase/class 3 adenylate cyclase
MVCAHCGADNPASVKFCGQCGSPLTRRCEHCGFVNPPGFHFCGNCGQALAGQPAGAAIATTPSTAMASRDAERRQMTVMFCDLVGSTPLSERLDPEDLREVIRAYQEVCERMISRYEGYTAAYLGDGLLIYFGYPLAHENDAHRAVRAALGIVEALGRLNARLQTERGIRLGVRLGIHTGVVVVGEMGAGERRDTSSIVGEHANIAARVQAAAEPDTVVISAATYHLIEGFFECQSLGAHALKGISRTLELYQVMHESTARSRLDVEAGFGLTPLVGRKQELGLLLEGWEQVRDGVGRVVLLSGEAGIGKSRLVAALKDYVASDPRAWLTPFQCSPYYQNSSLYPVVDLLQRVVLQLEPTETTEQRLDKLEAFLDQYGMPLADMVPLFAALLSMPLNERYPPLNLSAEQQKQRLLEAVLQVLLERARQQPLLLVVEDLHWIDPTTLQLLSLLVDQGPTARILAVFTYRPDFSPPWLGRSHVTHVTLNRLTNRQVADLVKALAHGKELPEELLAQIIEKTDGVALFVEELTKMVLESGVLQEQADRYALAVPLRSLAIPATLQGSLTARLDGLTSAKEVAQLAATLGREFSYELLQTVSGLDDPRLRNALTRLVEAELLYQRGVPPRAAYLFKHALVQGVAYESMLKSKRQQVHQKIAQVLAERFPEIAETQPELLAHHCAEAGLTEQAIRYWLRAGERAAQQSANPEAIANLAQGLALLGMLPDSPQRARQELLLQMALTGPLIATQGYGAAETLRAYTRARELGEQLGEVAQLFPLLYGQWVTAIIGARMHTTLEVAQQFMRLADQQADTAPILMGHRLLGITLVNQGEIVQGRAELERTLALYDPQQHRGLAFHYGQDAQASSLTFLARAQWLGGYPDQALHSLQEAVDVARALNHANTLAYVLYYGGALLAQFRGDVQSVREYTQAVTALAEEKRLSMWLAYATVSKGWTLTKSGQMQEGISQMTKGLADLRARGTELFRPHLLGMLAEAYGDAGQAKAGLDVLAEALATVESTHERQWEAELHRLKGELCLDIDDIAAESSFRRALEIAHKQHAQMLELRAATSLARLAQKRGESQDTATVLHEVYARFSEGFDTSDLREARTLIGT